MKITLKETHKSIYELVSLFKTKITKKLPEIACRKCSLETT